MSKKLISLIATLVVLLPLAGRAAINDIFKGWGWNSVNTGWLSLNSINTGSGNYGVTIDAGKNLSGYAWSSKLGWICYGSTCPGDPPGAPATSWGVFDDSVSPPQLRGWARIYSLYTLAPGGQQGWVSLNCSNMASCASSNYYTYVSLTDGFFRGWAWNSTSSGGSYAGGTGWIRFDPAYGVPQFTDPYKGTFAAVPWLKVLNGDLYSKGNISTPSPFTSLFAQTSATYCLDKGTTATISNFVQGTCPFPLTTNLSIPKAGSGYTTTLGRIDLAGIAAGKFGTRNIIANLNTDVPATLVGSVYETTSVATYGWTGKTFNNAAGANSGAGLIIVRGNLNITGDVLYQVGAITRLKQLASVGILVLDDGSGTKGNVTIAPGVGTVSANIYAEGIISTGTTGDPNTDVPLVINGVLVAKQFLFQRSAGSLTKPSEKVVYDGRIVANTPPGMNDFVQSLPVISN